MAGGTGIFSWVNNFDDKEMGTSHGEKDFVAVKSLVLLILTSLCAIHGVAGSLLKTGHGASSDEMINCPFPSERLGWRPCIRTCLLPPLVGLLCQFGHNGVLKFVQETYFHH